jgi:Transglutaminase-like superfamily
MLLEPKIAGYYLCPARMTASPPGGALEKMPRDIPALCETVQGLLLHEHWSPAYGETLLPARRAESQIRPVKELLARAAEHDPAPLTKPRPPGRRVVGVCRHFTLVTVAALRARGVPARARCGFATYFERGAFIDHWVAEYW